MVAMMLGQVEPKHFRRLARPCVRLGRAAARSISWSGTMFEYLMPEICSCARAPARSLIETERVRGGRAPAKAAGRARGSWPVGRDANRAITPSIMHLNYQYRAFGLREAGVGRTARARSVVAPYAVAAGAVRLPREGGGQRAGRCAKLGWRGELRLLRSRRLHRRASGRRHAEAWCRSYMAHHQGMALAALANALTGDAHVRDASRASPRRGPSRLLLG